MQSKARLFADETTWKEHLDKLEITDKRHRRIATEGALLGTLKACGFPPDLVIISDDAGQFNVLAHALCWIHADRVFQRIVPLNDKHAEELEWVRTQIWEIYADLKHYKCVQDPGSEDIDRGTFQRTVPNQNFFRYPQPCAQAARKKQKGAAAGTETPGHPAAQQPQ